MEQSLECYILACFSDKQEYSHFSHYQLFELSCAVFVPIF